MNTSLPKLTCMFIILASAASSQFFEKEHTVRDVKSGITWLRCSVGQTWNMHEQTCLGEIVKLNQQEVMIAIEQASEQLGGSWRLPNLEELQGLVCETCEPPKIKEKYFPNVSPEAYWTRKKNFLNKKMYWTVNFMTGHSYSRFFGYQRLPVLLVQDD